MVGEVGFVVLFNSPNNNDDMCVIVQDDPSKLRRNLSEKLSYSCTPYTATIISYILINNLNGILC